MIKRKRGRKLGGSVEEVKGFVFEVGEEEGSKGSAGREEGDGLCVVRRERTKRRRSAWGSTKTRGYGRGSRT